MWRSSTETATGRARATTASIWTRRVCSTSFRTTRTRRTVRAAGGVAVEGRWVRPWECRGHRQEATKWLDWNTIGPIAQKYQALIAADVKTDTRNLSTYEAFQSGVETLK